MGSYDSCLLATPLIKGSQRRTSENQIKNMYIPSINIQYHSMICNGINLLSPVPLVAPYGISHIRWTKFRFRKKLRAEPNKFKIMKIYNWSILS